MAVATLAFYLFVQTNLNSFDVTPIAEEGCVITYSMKSSRNVEYDKGTMLSGEATTLIPVLGENSLQIKVTKYGKKTVYDFVINKVVEAMDLVNEDYRPQVHFSPEINFMNDPNGLVYDSSNNTWHMFYQSSPQLHAMKDQDWGHAVSTDLIYWEELPIAIYGDDLGDIFSGSCIEDTNNSTGFFGDNKEGESKLVAIYTNASLENPDGFVQSIAYSKDHGMTWTKYEGNPVIEGLKDLTRDPKVFKVPGDPNDNWYATTGTLFESDKSSCVRLFASKDLKSWKQVQIFENHKGKVFGSECPGMEIYVLLDREGNLTGEKKWVLNCGSEQYMIGDMVLQDDGYYNFVVETNLSSQTAGGFPYDTYPGSSANATQVFL